ncbi:hypothetical protein OPQ81_008794 [Rhizoctonia solani]|nr:hypothetical protein OPQ81_008794 [Rhizoctonia solani]
MYPDRKLQWLQDNGCSESDIAQVLLIVTARFNSLNASLSTIDTTAAMESVLEELDDKNEWLFREKPSATSELREAIRVAGGPLRYWEGQAAFSTYAKLAKFAIDYLSVPGKQIFDVTS